MVEQQDVGIAVVRPKVGKHVEILQKSENLTMHVLKFHTIFHVVKSVIPLHLETINSMILLCQAQRSKQVAIHC